MRWTVVAGAAAVATILWANNGGTGSSEPSCFVGDYSTGDFSQWHSVQNQAYLGPGAEYAQSYSATIVPDHTKGHAARFELRAGDVLTTARAKGERSEVMAGDEALAAEGDVTWYQFSTKFDVSFPQNHADLGWGITNQFWGASGASPPLAWSVGERNGYWSLIADPQSGPGQPLGRVVLFEIPLKTGEWHDVVMQVHWTPTDEGWVKLWLNGQRQALANGEETFRIRTMIPGARTVRYKEGYYRHQAASTPTGIVFHAGFRCSARDVDI